MLQKHDIILPHTTTATTKDSSINSKKESFSVTKVTHFHPSSVLYVSIS
jgi:hypothetical protein